MSEKRATCDAIGEAVTCERCGRRKKPMTRKIRSTGLSRAYATTWREYKARKRAEIRTVRQVFDALWSGGAYLPKKSAGRLNAIRGELEALAVECSVKEWGR